MHRTHTQIRNGAMVAAAGVALLVTIGAATTASARTTGAHLAPVVATGSSPATATVPPTSAPAPAPAIKPLVILYGDSLGGEAQGEFAKAFASNPGIQVIIRTYGGTAICDWLDRMRDDATTLVPGVVVIEFSGNALTTCMEDATGQPLGGTAYVDRYRADTQTAIDLFAGARVFLAGAPISRTAEANGDFRGGQLNNMYAVTALLARGVTYVDAGASVLDHGRWTATLPCLADEPCTGGTDASGQGVNVVRAPDGGHFCPASEEAKRGVVGDCPVWSSGAFRFAQAMAAPVLTVLGD
jgi:hypothetical protein